jgi:hypothetical protein
MRNALAEVGKIGGNAIFVAVFDMSQVGSNTDYTGTTQLPF